ncbi:MAG: DUF2007 domain-containing protein [Opitutaceae bacterium]|nr:DUF2007 domain-containing protein [Opitutaceae bacterium]
MTTVTTCSNLAEAELIHSLLTDNGIEAFVLDDAFGGLIRVQVDEARAEDARRLLEEVQKEFANEDDDEEGDDDAPAPRA